MVVKGSPEFLWPAGPGRGLRGAAMRRARERAGRLASWRYIWAEEMENRLRDVAKTATILTLPTPKPGRRGFDPDAEGDRGAGLYVRVPARRSSDCPGRRRNRAPGASPFDASMP